MPREAPEGRLDTPLPLETLLSLSLGGVLPSLVEDSPRHITLLLLCPSLSDSHYSLVLRGEEVDRPVLTDFAPVGLVHINHLADAETQGLARQGKARNWVGPGVGAMQSGPSLPILPANKLGAQDELRPLSQAPNKEGLVAE